LRLVSHLWTGGPQPIEYLKLIFYRTFGWTPAELRSVPLPDILQILTCMQVEADVAAMP